MLLPCSYQQLLDAGIYTEEVDQIRAGTNRGTPYVRGVVERSHAGVLLERAEQGLRGETLLTAAAEAILAGRVLAEASKELLDDLHVWAIMARWPSFDPHRNWEGDETPPEPEAFLHQRLRELGVVRDEDLMLLEPDDLRPQLPKILKAYRYDIESMGEDFPRIWEHQGHRYHCRVNPIRRTVILEPADKATARADDPKARFVPRFRGFDVHYRNASRRVPLRS